MAGLFACSADHISTATATQKWSEGGTVVPVGKHGRGHRGSWGKALATVRSRRFIAGCWFRNSIRFGPTYPGTLSTSATVTTSGDGSFHYTVLDGSLTTYVSDVDLWRPDKWHFLELDVVLSTDTSNGTLLVYLDDPTHAFPIIDLSSVYTVSNDFATGEWGWNGCRFFTNDVMDDIYVLDGTATDVFGHTGAPNSPLGPIRIDVVRPDGVGDLFDFEPDPNVANWRNVSEDVPDETTRNLASATGSPTGIGAVDLHEMEDINTGDTAIFQHLMVSAYKTDGGAGTLAMLAKHGGVTYDLETRLLAESPFYRTRVMLHCMPDGDPLTDSAFNNQQMGYRREA